MTASRGNFSGWPNKLVEQFFTSSEVIMNDEGSRLLGLLHQSIEKRSLLREEIAACVVSALHGVT